MATGTSLKQGSCGDIVLDTATGAPRIVRELGAARFGCRWMARLLARREARSLAWLSGTDGIPALMSCDRDRLIRSYVPGRPMHEARPDSRAYFRDALDLLRHLHAQGVAHNDLAKEANWLCRDDGRAAIVDFQLALRFKTRGRLFRLLAREDLRHLLKHKAHYCPELMTPRQRALVAQPSALARGWRVLVKPIYRFVTRRLLRWPERPGAAERQRTI